MGAAGQDEAGPTAHPASFPFAPTRARGMGGRNRSADTNASAPIAGTAPKAASCSPPIAPRRAPRRIGGRLRLCGPGRGSPIRPGASRSPRRKPAAPMATSDTACGGSRVQQHLAAISCYGAHWRMPAGVIRRQAHGHLARARQASQAMRSSSSIRLPRKQPSTMSCDGMRNSSRPTVRCVFWASRCLAYEAARSPLTDAGLAAAAHREGAGAVRRYLAHRAANLPPPVSVRGRGDLSSFNEIERRLRAFADTPYGALRR